MKPGADVFGVTHSRRVSNLVQMNSKDLVVKPNHLTFSQAATLPSCLSLAYYSLQQATPKSTILIHEANRSLGLAALVIARALGFSVICTTSDPMFSSSRRQLISLGASGVTDQHCTGS